MPTISAIFLYKPNNAFIPVLKPCIESFLNQTEPFDELIVCCEKNFVDQKVDYSVFKGFKVVEVVGDLGWCNVAWLKNVGLVNATGDYVYMTGIDGLAPPDLAKQLRQALNKYRMVSITINRMFGNQQRSNHECYGWLSYHRKDALAIGGYDQRMIDASNQDADFYARLARYLKRGQKYYSREIVVKHIEHEIPVYYDESITQRNARLYRTNPIIVNIDVEIGSAKKPVRHTNLIDYTFLKNNPYREQLMSYKDPFDLQYSKEWEVPYLIEHTMPFKHRCLDAGCGRSPFPRWLNDFRECEVYAIDNESSDYHNIPDKKYWGKVQYQNADIRNLPFENDFFDRAYCISVLEHLPESDIRSAASELARVCKGIIGISLDFNFYSIGGGFTRQSIDKYLIGPIGHKFELLSKLVIPVDQEHVDMLRSTGLSNSDCTYVAFTLFKKT